MRFETETETMPNGTKDRQKKRKKRNTKNWNNPNKNTLLKQINLDDDKNLERGHQKGKKENC